MRADRLWRQVALCAPLREFARHVVLVARGSRRRRCCIAQQAARGWRGGAARIGVDDGVYHMRGPTGLLLELVLLRRATRASECRQRHADSVSRRLGDPETFVVAAGCLTVRANCARAAALCANLRDAGVGVDALGRSSFEEARRARAPRRRPP